MKPSEFIKNGWCRHFLAVDEHDNPCPLEFAAKKCISGAVLSSDLDDEQQIAILSHIREQTHCSVILWNDYICSSQEEALETVVNAESEVLKELSNQ